MLFFLSVIVILIVIVFLFVQQSSFGRLPSRKRLETVKQSPYYKGGQFQNLSPTPNLTEGASLYTVFREFFFGKHERKKPVDVLPSVKTNLQQLDISENILVWFGHSSYFIQIDGKRFLVDPVFSGAASPVSFTTRSFAGADIFKPEDMPSIDYLVITHDHWDHLDYSTVLKLKHKTGKIICGLGVGEHFERWGFDISKIIEKQWNETAELENGFTLHATPARHFSGRGFSRNKSLWMSYVLQTPSMKIYIGGDSGYDTHFKMIGDQYGPFDLAILECGQYDKNWRYIHTHPEEFVKAAKEINARKILMVHWAKFQLGNHPWDEPIIKVSRYAAAINLPLLTPMIGEKVELKSENQQFAGWWEGLN
ncbi:MAG: MBL fold metallo-hydrolase [Ferruginibacter sp.]